MTAVTPRPVAVRPWPLRPQVKGSALARFLRTTDAKQIGIMYLVTSFVFFHVRRVDGTTASARSTSGSPSSASTRRSWCSTGSALGACPAGTPITCRPTASRSSTRSPRSVAFVLGARRCRSSTTCGSRTRSVELVTVDDPWGHGNSLEWATSCPPPLRNFDRMPRIRSERPAFDAKYP